MTNIFLSGARAAALLVSFALASCGGGSAKTVEVTGNDAMQFSVNKIEATAPATLTINFRNVGSQPKAIMGHNLVVLKPGVVPLDFSLKCSTNGGNLENGHLPEAVMGDVIAHTKLLGPGESDSITLTLDKAGTYPYVCTFTGHAALMKGEIVVK